VIHTSDDAEAEIALIVSAAAVPMTIVDYTPIIERFTGCALDEIKELLSNEDEFLACLRLPRTLASSQEWLDLYGSPLAADTPDLPDRQFSAERYPDLARSMIDQLTAPFEGISFIVREHVAPTVAGDVVVRSHWKASQLAGVANYSRIVIVDLDVTDLRATQRSLSDAVEAKDRLVATIAHELRNPVTSMVGFTSILDSDWETLDDASRREMASLTATQASDVALLLEDLLAAAAGPTVPVSDDALELDVVLAGVDLEGFTRQVEPGVIVWGDQLRIRQIVRNLVSNARRYGGPTRELHVEVHRDQIRVSVRDDGQGLVTGLASRLFEPLATGGASGSLGLGLSVSRQLARAMGGDLGFDRRSGWTVFELILRRTGWASTNLANKPSDLTSVGS
jgi:signal transduction histidine kinase